MARVSTIYDLVLLLSDSAAEEERERILSEVESAITDGGGTIEHRQDWGRRPMPYAINHEREAEYHLVQFSAPPAVLDTLSHSLRIADEVVRFRIIKVTPGTPPPPESPPPLVGIQAPASATPAAVGAPAVGDADEESDE